MAKSKSSKAWLKEHANDEFVKRAQREGYRSRAVYKLMEIQARDRLIKPNQIVVDLGAAPGSWSQYVAELIGKNGRVIGLDILPMDPLDNVTFIQGDFLADDTYAKLLAEVDELQGDKAGIDLVICDIAPNSTGIKAVDQPRSMYLVELAYAFALERLKPGGDFLCKVFQGEGFDTLFKTANQDFDKAMTRKPKASRDRSREVYLLAKGKK